MQRRWFRRALHPRDIAKQAREQYTRVYALGERISAGSETLAESAQYLDRTAAAATQAVERLQALLTGGIEEVVAASPELGDAVFRRLIDGKPSDLTPAASQLLDYSTGYEGFAAQAGLWFNPPVCVVYSGGEPRVSHVTERIVEVPFVFAALSQLELGATVADIGAAESSLGLSLASLGYRVIAVDPRGYSLAHPNLTVAAATVADWDQPAASLDAVVCLSVLEHLGLNAYGEGVDNAAADVDALGRLRTLLKPGGLLVLTVPVGAWSVGSTERTYDRVHLNDLLEGWSVDTEVLVQEAPDGVWVRQDAAEIGPSRGVMLVVARS